MLKSIFFCFESEKKTACKAMQKSLPNPTGNLFHLQSCDIASALEASRASIRKRVMLPIQRSQEAGVQRLVNILQPGTYIQPHCHPSPHASESLCLIQGELVILLFSEKGDILSQHTLNQSAPLIDIEPNTWHGMIVSRPDTVIFEVKQGPYDSFKDKKFAKWAPPEDSPDVNLFLETLISSCARQIY